jgi:hypothetical protein
MRLQIAAAISTKGNLLEFVVGLPTNALPV